MYLAIDFFTDSNQPSQHGTGLAAKGDGLLDHGFGLVDFGAQRRQRQAVPGAWRRPARPQHGPVSAVPHARPPHRRHAAAELRGRGRHEHAARPHAHGSHGGLGAEECGARQPAAHFARESSCAHCVP